MNVSFANNSDDIIHQQALSSAKSGQYEYAIFLLRPLIDKYPKPNRFFYDYLSILFWAGQYQNITGYDKEVNIEHAPRYVLKSLAFSFRQQQNFVRSEQIYSTLVNRFPHFTEAKIGLALVYIDQHKFKHAQAVLQPLRDKFPDNLDMLNAFAYFYETKKIPLLALSIYEQILVKKPNDIATFKKKVLILNSLGASHLAYSMITDSKIFTHGELARIRADMAAHRLRWGTIAVKKIKNRFNETDQAIEDIRHNYEQASHDLGELHPLTLTNQFDLLLALHNRYKMKRVLELNNKLEKQKTAIPAYAKNAVCDALLYEELPQQAVGCYQQVIQSGYTNINSKIALFYAYLENENFLKAQYLIKKIAKEQPALIKGVGRKKIIKPNFKKLQTETVKALGTAFSDDLEDADARFTWMNNRAPYNLDLRKELANIDYWRGWPHKAQEEYEIGLQQEPKHLGLRLGQARNWLELKEYQKAEQSINTLYQQYPEDKGIAKQKKLWDIHNMREFRTELNRSSSSGSINGSRGFDINSYLFSSPMANNYRIYLHQYYADASFVEGNGLLNHAGVGGEYRAPNIRLTSELHRNHYNNNRIGIDFAAEYAFDDYLSGSISMESLSRDTPLRALNQGVYAKSATLTAQYRWHESRNIGLNLAYLDFSDKNQRKSVGGFWRERWYNQYNYKFSTRIDVYHSQNSKRNRIYFNPDSDFSAGISLENDWLTWRKYNNTFHQRVILSTGVYQQQNFSSGNIWGLQYEHRWQVKKRVELGYGLKRAKARYDGNYEYTWNYFMTLGWKF